MRLGIDAREIEKGVYTGIGRSLMQFLRYFDAAQDNDHCVLFSARTLPFQFGPRIENRIIEPCQTFWWDQILLPLAIRKESVELFFSPYYKIPLMAPCRKVSSVLDVMYLKYGPYARALSLWHKAYYAVMGPCFAKASKLVWTGSDYSKKDIIETYSLAPEKIIVIPLAVSHSYHPLEGREEISGLLAALGIRGRYILYSGNFKPHKNVSTLVKAFALLSSRIPDLGLVLVAPRAAGYEDILELAARLGVGARVVFTDKITDEGTLRALYAQAEVFVMPSLYEGFGLPPVEAMACGTPVVCANATCLPQTCAGAALLVDPYQPAAFADAMERIMNDPLLRDELRAKGLLRVQSIREDQFGRRLYAFMKGAAGEVGTKCP